MDKPPTEPTNAIERRRQRQPKVSACSLVADDPPRALPAPSVCRSARPQVLPNPGAARRVAATRNLAESKLDRPLPRKGGYRPWSKEADGMLIACVAFKMKVIEKRMKRSIASIRLRLAVLYRGSESFGGFKTKDLMEMLRLDESTIRRLERKRLLARQRGRITKDSLKSLCREHPEEIPFETLDQDTKRMLVANYEYGKHTKRRHVDGQLKAADI